MFLKMFTIKFQLVILGAYRWRCRNGYKWISKYGCAHNKTRRSNPMWSNDNWSVLCFDCRALREFTGKVCGSIGIIGWRTWLSKSYVRFIHWRKNNETILLFLYWISVDFSLSASETPYTQKYEVASAVRHPSYSSEKDINDIAVITLRKPIAFNQGVGPICLPFK